MDYRRKRAIASGFKVLGLMIIFVGMAWGSMEVGAGIYNHDDSQLGGGYQILGVSIGISIGLLILGGIWDRVADDMRHEELMEKLSQVRPDRMQRRR
ncbi:MAG: hypothetical protein KAH57_06275 [Thermoplasmata archaeon]|nr:hypothetical protein [Thermoplasmata archaeon]